MRDFFIRAFEFVIHIVVVIMLLGVLLGTISLLLGNNSTMMTEIGLPEGQGPLAALLFFLGGLLYVVIFGGLLYLGLGIYQNTRRTARALEAMQAAGQTPN